MIRARGEADHGLGVVGLQIDRLSKRVDRGVELIGVLEGIGEVVVRPRKIRPQADGGLELLDCRRAFKA